MWSLCAGSDRVFLIKNMPQTSPVRPELFEGLGQSNASASTSLSYGFGLVKFELFVMCPGRGFDKLSLNGY